ncbi:MAG: hypothetical protein AAF570_21140, partial [Bacteroidota bacterium]
MSIFDYPRINFSGYIALNPGTANNDDYAQGGQVTLPKTPEYGKYGGEVLGLIDSINVVPRTYGMSDADFIAWAQKAHPFDGASAPIIPAEWNYYGPQTMAIDNSTVHGNKISASIVGVQTGPGQSYTSPERAVPLSGLVNQPLTLSGHVTDINSEGSPPATQFFVDKLTIGSGSPLSGFSKGVGAWLNFFRNVNLTADGGAGAYVYHVLPKAQMGELATYFTADNLQGVIFRYYLYRAQLKGTNDELQNDIYPKHGMNPAPLQIAGTIAPWYEGEDITSVPVGRLLVANSVDIPTESKKNNGGGTIALAPAVLRYQDNRVQADFSGTFPDNFQDMHHNPKYNLGSVSLYAHRGDLKAKISDIDYSDTDGGNQLGWVFDYEIPNSKDAMKVFGNSKPEDVTFSLQLSEKKPVLEETDYYFVSNQMAVYGEQGGPGDSFINQGTAEPVTLSVYHRGVALDASNCPPISVWWYRTNPIQSPGNAELVTKGLCPGDPITVP